MIDSIQKWAEKPLNIKLFFGMIIALSLGIVVPWLLDIYDNDMYFIIATGREIIENGIPTTNIWTIDNSEGFVSQQWLYAVILAFVADSFGAIGCFIFMLCEFFVFIALLVYFFRLKNINTGFIIFSLAVICLFSKLYTFNLRPQLITLIILLIECIGLEKYRLSGKAAWLALLPVSMLLEVNLHGSMWPMHFAIILAYIVPAFYLKMVNRTTLPRRFKPIIIAVLATLAVTVINPYGFDNILYIIKSFRADSFDYISIVELAPSDFISTGGLCIIINLAMLVLSLYFKTLGSTTLNITLGLSFMMMLHMRNQMFEPIALIYLLSDTYEYIKTKDIDFRKDITNAMGGVLICVTLFFCANCGVSIAEDTASNPMEIDLQDACDYIKSQDVENPRIFAGFNLGGYFEWQGFKQVYMDARPELYTREFTGDKHILSEYYSYTMSGVHSDSKYSDYGLPVTEEEMNTWFYDYDFDYVCIMNSVEIYLAAYMEHNSDYQRVEECTNENYVLYEKVNM